ncbi:MAG: GNAT family N-acetyltransferase, partial [Verrucomicrobiales bacterium]|nr:GNAT family N-acetyltransferase [Verrucomicrobiales bacterium]
MIHADDYQQIRKASPSDVGTLLSMMEQSMDDAALVPRSREQLQSKIADFFVLELDGNPIGCVAVHCFEEPDKSSPLAELACLFVRRSQKNKGHAQKLVTFAEETARQKGCHRLFALSTQAFRFFEEKAGFAVSDPQALPPARREQYERSGRNSKVLVKDLKA